MFDLLDSLIGRLEEEGVEVLPVNARLQQRGPDGETVELELGDVASIALGQVLEAIEATATQLNLFPSAPTLLLSAALLAVYRQLRMLVDEENSQSMDAILAVLLNVEGVDDAMRERVLDALVHEVLYAQDRLDDGAEESDGEADEEPEDPPLAEEDPDFDWHALLGVDVEEA